MNAEVHHRINNPEKSNFSFDFVGSEAASRRISLGGSMGDEAAARGGNHDSEIEDLLWRV